MQDLPKIVRSRLEKATAVESHPDADLLTAFAERTLAKSERLRVVEHLAGCGGCREVVTLALPSVEALEPLSSTRIVRSSWFSLPVLRWGIVAAGIVAVTSFSIVRYRAVQYRQRQSRSENVASSLVAQNNTSSAAQAVQPSPPASEPQVVLPQTESRQPKVRSQALPRIPARRLELAIPPLPAVIEGQPEADPLTAQNQVPDQFALSQKEPLLENRSLTDPDVVKAKDPALPQAASIGARWTISSAGSLQRSFDAGKTWEEVKVNAKAEGDSSQLANTVQDEQKNAQKKILNKTAPSVMFRAVAAIGSEVWAGGSGATLYHSGDSGAHWTRVLPSSAAAGVAGDITGIEFSDPQHGRIATSAGEFWITGDGGHTWDLER